MPTSRKPGSAVDLVVAATAAEIAAVQRFRYGVLVQELGGESVDADPATHRIADALDVGARQVYLRGPEREILGAVRLVPNAADFAPPELVEALRLADFLRFGRDVAWLLDRLVLSARGSSDGWLAALLGGAIRLARREGARFLFTSVPPAQVRSFQQIGFRRYGDNFVDPDDRYLIPLVLLTEDQIHLTMVGSPIAPLFAREVNSPTTADWFERTYAGMPRFEPSAAVNEEEVWRHLTDRLRRSPLEGIALLRDLDFREARRFIGVGTLLRCRAGDRIVAKGDIGREMFVLIAGEVEVRLPRKEGGATAVARFQRGEVFGEMAYLSETPRSADVVAQEDCEVLVLTRQSVGRAIEEMPVLAARVLFNLSLILCARLRETTARLI